MKGCRTALLVAYVVAVSLGAWTPAAAEDDAGGYEVAVSLDGVHYSPEVGAPLFDPGFRWMPGDGQVARLWVRNQADDRGDLSIDLVPRHRMTLFQSGYLTVSARAGSGAWTTVRDGAPLRLVGDTRLPPESEIPVFIRVDVSPDAPNGTMVLATDFDILVTLIDARAGSQASGHAGPAGVLPDTGATTSWWVVPLGLLLLSAGTALVLRRDPHRPARASLVFGEI